MAPTATSVTVALVLGFVVGHLYGTGSSSTSSNSQPIRVRETSGYGAGKLSLQSMPGEPIEAEPPPPPPSASSITPGSTSVADPYLLIGVISAPNAFGRRAMLRSFAEASGGDSTGSARRSVATEFVFGDRFYEGEPSVEMQRRLAEESQRHGDIIFVDAREKLPHVGKATEKSAAWWLTAPLRSNARFFCKTDDDSLLHHDHLTSALAAAEEAAIANQRQAATGGGGGSGGGGGGGGGSGEATATPNVLFSYVRWRGWLPGHRFQACGGGWGGPIDCIRHMTDPSEQCTLAEGPFPQGTGQLTCLSRGLAKALATHAGFRDFYRVSMARNDFGQRCTTAQECATHPPGLHMWHHEDAGISYNAWKAALAANLSVSIVHMPEKGWIWPWFNPKIAEPALSARAILMHKVTPALLPEVLRTWKVRQPAPSDLYADCSQRCSQWGWQWARHQCAPPPALPPSAGPWRGFGLPWNGSLCKIDPSIRYRCCFLNTRSA